MSKWLEVLVCADDHIRGLFGAPLELVQYGDYECSACGEAYLVVKHIENTLENELRCVFRNFPRMQAHPRALEAARAAEAAGIQGKFWEMHDRIFENQTDLDDGSLLSHASGLDLDLEDFIADMRSPFISKRIETDYLQGVRSGVRDTPTFFVNGRKFEGVIPFDLFKQMIDRSL